MIPLWTTNKGFGKAICGSCYISKVNGAINVKSDAQVAELKPCVEFIPCGGWRDNAPHVFKHLELSEASRATKLIFGLQVNIDKANSRRYDVTL